MISVFHRLSLEQWQDALTIVSFVLFVCAFAVFLGRAIGMPRAQVAHMENLPLEGEPHE